MLFNNLLNYLYKSTYFMTCSHNCDDFIGRPAVGLFVRLASSQRNLHGSISLINGPVYAANPPSRWVDVLHTMVDKMETVHVGNRCRCNFMDLRTEAVIFNWTLGIQTFEPVSQHSIVIISIAISIFLHNEMKTLFLRWQYIYTTIFLLFKLRFTS